MKILEEALGKSARLDVINKSFKDLDTDMATLCCDVSSLWILN